MRTSFRRRRKFELACRPGARFARGRLHRAALEARHLHAILAMRRRRHFALPLLVLLLALPIAGYVGYLAVANLRVSSLIADQARRMDLKVDYRRAYSLYPGHLTLREVAIEPRTTPRWSVSLREVTFRFHPTGLDLQHWDGEVVVPEQRVLAERGTHALEATVATVMRAQDVRFPVESLRKLAGTIEIPRAVLRSPSAPPSSFSGAFVIRSALITPPAVTFGGDLRVQGDDGRELFESAGLGGAIHWLFPQLAGASWSLRGDAQLSPSSARLAALQFESADVTAVGEVAIATTSGLSGAILLRAGATRLGVSIDGGEASTVFAPGDEWLDRARDRVSSIHALGTTERVHR